MSLSVKDKTEVLDLEGKSDFFSFQIADLSCCVHIDQVHEVIKIDRITQMHRVPSFIKGAINVRGEILSVLNLHQIFGFVDEKLQAHSRIIVSMCNKERIGMLVDCVHGVESLKGKDFEAVPSNTQDKNQAFFKQAYRLEKKIGVLLNLESIFHFCLNQ